MSQERIDDLQFHGLKIIQNPHTFCFGIDAVLLADFAAGAHSAATLDLCSGNGIVPILLAGKTNTPRLCGLEIQPDIATMATRSIELNSLQKRVSMVCANATQAANIFGKGSFDVVTCNPPYMPHGGGLVNADDAKTIARHEIYCTLEDIIAVSYQLLKPGGKLFMVHRPERLVDILSLMRQYRIEPKRLQMVHPSVGKKANIMLIEGLYHGGKELKMMPPLYVYDQNGYYSNEINAIYGRTP